MITKHKMKSNIVNDLLHGAATFGSPAKAIAELVWNGVQYQPKGQHAIVDVTIDKDRRGYSIVISDNGRGMDYSMESGFERFFYLHSDNLDREMGDPGRGRFGIGAKQALVGLKCSHAKLSSVKDGLFYLVDWNRGNGREDMEDWFDHTPEPTSHPNGTEIKLVGIPKKRIAVDLVVDFLKRSLGRHLLQNQVRVNGERVVYEEPLWDEEFVVESPLELQPLIGSVTLTLRVAKSMLSYPGIIISSNDVAHEEGFFGDYGKSQLAGKLYGFVDVPKLDEPDEEGQEAYTSERSMKLLRDNLRVQVLLPWINDQIAILVKRIESQEAEKRNREHEQQLEKDAKIVSKVLTSIYAEAMAELDLQIKLPPKNDGGLDLPIDGAVPTPGDQNITVKESPDGDIKAKENPDGDVVLVDTGGVVTGDGESDGGGGVHDKTHVTLGDGDLTVQQVPTSNLPSRKKSPRGNITVDWSYKFGGPEPRAHFIRDTLTLMVNMQAPELSDRTTKDPLFWPLAYQMATSEFAVVVTEAMIQGKSPEITDTNYDSVTFHIRRWLDKISAAMDVALKAKKIEEES